MNKEQVEKMEVYKLFEEFKRGAEMNVNMQVKKAILECDEYILSAAIKANERTVSEEREMSLGSLTKKVIEMDSKLVEMKHSSNPYVLAQKVINLNEMVERVRQDLNNLTTKYEEMRKGKFLDTSITSEELKLMYNASGCNHIEVAKFLEIDPSRFYQILNGQEKNIDYKRRSDLKEYFKDKINALA